MDDFIAHVEPLSSIIRVFESDKTYGDQYVWCCAARWISTETVELCGVTSFPNMSYRHAIGKTLWNLGVKKIFFIRKVEDRERVVTIDVEKMAERERWGSN